MDTPDNSNSSRQEPDAETAEVVTRIFMPNPNVAAADYEAMRLTDAELAEIRISKE